LYFGFFIFLRYLMHLRGHLQVFGLNFIFELGNLVGSDLELSLQLCNFVLSLK